MAGLRGGEGGEEGNYYALARSHYSPQYISVENFQECVIEKEFSNLYLSDENIAVMYSRFCAQKKYGIDESSESLMIGYLTKTNKEKTSSVSFYIEGGGIATLSISPEEFYVDTILEDFTTANFSNDQISLLYARFCVAQKYGSGTEKEDMLAVLMKKKE